MYVYTTWYRESGITWIHTLSIIQEAQDVSATNVLLRHRVNVDLCSRCIPEWQHKHILIQREVTGANRDPYIFSRGQGHHPHLALSRSSANAPNRNSWVVLKGQS